MAKQILPGPIRVTDYILPLLTFIASWAIGVWFYNHMPENVPVHWGLTGQPDRWGSRLEGALAVPIVLSILMIMFVALSRTRAGRLMLAIAAIMGLFMIAIQLVIGLNSMGVLINVSRIIMLCLAGLFLALGLIVPQLPQNKFGGYRNSYTLSDLRVWESTNKLGGRMLLIAGLLIIPFAFTPPLISAAGSFAVIIICVVIIPTVHSIALYKHLKRQA